MKYARDSRPGISHEKTAQLLFEALPWIKNLTGKTIVIKYGGAAMVDPKLRDDVMSDIVLLKIIGVNPVIVHGGGADINAALKHYDIPVEFKDGQRVTAGGHGDCARGVAGKVNQSGSPLSTSTATWRWACPVRCGHHYRRAARPGFGPRGKHRARKLLLP